MASPRSIEKWQIGGINCEKHFFWVALGFVGMFEEMERKSHSNLWKAATLKDSLRMWKDPSRSVWSSVFRAFGQSCFYKSPRGVSQLFLKHYFLSLDSIAWVSEDHDFLSPSLREWTSVSGTHQQRNDQFTGVFLLSKAVSSVLYFLRLFMLGTRDRSHVCFASVVCSIWAWRG